MIEVRNAKQQDIEKVVELENQIWPEGTRAPKEKFEGRLKIFPEGFFVAYDSGKLVGASTSEIIEYNPAQPPISWEAVTDYGWIRKTHNPKGSALYVVSVGAVSRSGAGSALVNAQKNLARELNLDVLILGARIPGYDAYCKEKGEISINDYVKLERSDRQLLDPELRFYTRNGLKITKIIPNYMEDDKESRNYGALMIWEND